MSALVWMALRDIGRVRAAAPSRDGIQLPLRPFDHRGKKSKVNSSRVAVQRQEIAFAQNRVADGAPSRIQVDIQLRAGDEADLAKLPGHDRGVGGAATRGSQYTRCKRHP